MSVMQNNIYVHSNPPKAVSGSGFAIRQWVKSGDIDKLESTVLEGQGARLLGLAETTTDARVKSFLRSVPGLMSKVDMIHDAVVRGSLRETQALLDKRKLASARDAVGRGLPHKAVLYNNKAVIEWLAKKYPETLNLRDNEGRTPLHYSAATKDVEDTYKLLVSLGASSDISDLHGHKPMYYVEHPEELDIEGPSPTAGGGGASTGRSLSRGKRRRISPISKESHSPRKFIISPVNTINNSINNITHNISSYFSQQSSPPSVSRAQIRIWIHEKDIPKLERIVWSGNGEKLLLETSNNGKVRRFLDNVPHLLSRIKSVHTAAINNDVESLKDIRRRTELVEIFKSQDSHGLTCLHKAAGLGNRFVLEYLIYEIPELINITDRDGRTPLHYASKDTGLYSFLVKAGADENVVDSRGRTPAYYKTHQNDLDTRYLRNVPDAPRVSGDLLGWDRESTAGVSSHITTGSLSKRRISSGEFSLTNDVNDGIVEATGKFDLDNVDAEIREDELRINDEDEDFEMEEERKEEVKMNGISVDDDELSEPEPPRSSVQKNQSMKSGSTSQVKREPSGMYASQQTRETSGMHSSQQKREPSGMNTSQQTRETSGMYTSQQKRETSGLVQPPPPPAYEDSWHMNETVEMINEDVNNSMEESANVVSGVGSRLERGASKTISAVESKIEEVKATTSAVKNKMEEAKVSASATKSRLEDSAVAAVSAAGSKLENTAVKAASGVKRATSNAKSTLSKVKVNGEEVEPALEVELFNEEDEDEKIYDKPSFEQRESGDNEENQQEQDEHYYRRSIGIEDDEEDEIDVALRNRDMETLVDKILQGQGSLLINRTTSHPDVQDFLNNVPAYMTKISAIHTAAATGSLRDLQTLLDRKRLALARDDGGRGPLHKAILNNHVHVAKHLANTYPQSLRLLDKNGRSPLHYAATLPDSGTMYKYLVNWGADPNAKDALNNTPGIYLRNRDLLSLKDLLATEGRVSRDSVRTKSRSRSGEGASLERQSQPGPTTSGASGSRAERWERPKTPDVAVLTALDNFYETILMREESFWTRAWRKMTTSTQGNVQVKMMVKKYLNRSLFDAMKRKSTASGATLMDVLKFYPQFFIVAPDPEVYDVFRQLFIPTLADVNQTSLGLGGGFSSYIFGDNESPTTLPVCEIPPVDIPSKYVSLVRMRLSRNILPFPFLPFMKRDDMTKVSNVLKTVSLNWPCFDLEVLDKETRTGLEQICWLPEVSKVSRYWPKSRYFLLSHDNSVQIWINAEDHLDIIVQSKYGKLYPMLETLNDVYLLYSKSFDFYRNEDFGYLTVDPFHCGTSLKITFRIRLPTLMQDRTDLTTLVTELNLKIRWKHTRIATSATKNIEIASDDWIEVENITTLGLNEIELCQAMSSAMNHLIRTEEERAKIVAMIEAANKNKK